MALTVHIITPERAFKPRPADAVNLPAFDGGVGILPKHAPFVCQLGAGLLRIKSSEHADIDYALQGGVAQVANDEVRILAESVVEANAVDQAHCLKRLIELDEATYESTLDLLEAKAEAQWLLTQLRSASADIPPLKQVG